jgi:hypothetical protein
MPRKAYQGIELLTDHPDHFISNFTIQFAYYLCRDINSDSNYRVFLENAAKADRLWFSQYNKGSQYWGLGAGSTRISGSGIVLPRPTYRADRINNNPYQVVSPHIISGFIPIDPKAKDDLLTLFRGRHCLYHHRQQQILWRCSLQNLATPMGKVQAVDYSSMFLGLSTLHPAVGGDFFQRFAPGT